MATERRNPRGARDILISPPDCPDCGEPLRGFWTQHSIGFRCRIDGPQFVPPAPVDLDAVLAGGAR